MRQELSSKKLFVDIEKLHSEGLSYTEIHTSLEIKCFKKNFSRVCVLPKKYQEKAINLCEEYLGDGFETFITESQYFFSVWKETPPNLVDTDSVNQEKPSEPITLQDENPFFEYKNPLQNIHDLTNSEEIKWWHGYIRY